MAIANKTETVGVRMTLAERRFLEREAEKLNVRLTDYCRAILLWRMKGRQGQRPK